jgi:hypothetical protein
MPAESPAPHPELAGLAARKAQLEAKLKATGLSAESKARTELFLSQVTARIAELSK